MKTRKYILKLIKSNNNEILYSLIIDNNIKERLEYIIERIVDSKYYTKKIIFLKKNEISGRNEISYHSSEKNFTLYPHENFKENKNYEIIKFKKIIEKYSSKIKEVNTADFITQIGKYFLIGGTFEYFFIFDEIYQNYKQIYYKEWIYNIISCPNVKKNNNEESQTIIGCSKNYIFKYTFNLLNNSDDLIIRDFTPNNNFLFGVNNEIYCCKESKLVRCREIGNRMIKTEYRIIDEFDNKLTKSAIKINSIIIFKSNKIVSNGEDKLIFYYLNNRNILTTNIDKDKKQYSFIYLANGLTLLPKNKKMPKNRILLCACKKYLRFQRNGILLLSFEDNNNIINKNGKLFNRRQSNF
jgi:hypothetical protein